MLRRNMLFEFLSNVLHTASLYHTYKNPWHRRLIYLQPHVYADIILVDSKRQ